MKTLSGKILFLLSLCCGMIVFGQPEKKAGRSIRSDPDWHVMYRNNAGSFNRMLRQEHPLSLSLPAMEEPYPGWLHYSATDYHRRRMAVKKAALRVLKTYPGCCAEVRESFGACEPEAGEAIVRLDVLAAYARARGIYDAGMCSGIMDDMYPDSKSWRSLGACLLACAAAAEIFPVGLACWAWYFWACRPETLEWWQSRYNAATA